MVKSIVHYRELGSIRDLAPTEKEAYIDFLNVTYADNLKAAEFLLIQFPRWSIIAAYYAMHDISKLFLARNYNLKLTSPHVHAAAVQALREFVKRKDIIGLIEKAEKEYDSIISLHLALLQGKDEREKSQYYTSDTVSAKVSLEKASYFLEKLAKPYVKLVLDLIK
ncbi:MAG TPA: hypothetical protein VJH97_01475 [Candidatus Nanoarchaeia archaeon]|nr:hypothetical protein [Candidatus Nanoarchaeia archaeon]